jgi:hypothetical protein
MNSILLYCSFTLSSCFNTDAHIYFFPLQCGKISVLYNMLHACNNNIDLCKAVQLLQRIYCVPAAGVNIPAI